VVDASLFALGVNMMTWEGVPPLDVVVGVDSLDVFMLTGLTLDIPGCSPPSRARFSLLRCMHFMVSLPMMVFTSHLRFFATITHVSHLAGHG